MAIVKHLDQAFVDHKLICPPGESKSEFVLEGGTGLYILVHASRPGQGTFFWRHRDPTTRKTRHTAIGKTTEMTLEAAKAATASLRVTLGKPFVPPAPVAPVPAKPAIAAPTAGIEDDMTLDAFMTELYFPHAKVHKRSWTRDDQLYRLRIKAKFGALGLSQITRKAVNQFKVALLGEGLSKASVNHHVQLLRHVFNLAVSWEVLDRNILKGIELLSLDNQVENYLDDAAFDRFVEVAKTANNVHVGLILLFLLSTGARLREGLCAEWKQIDVANRVWKIPATNTKSKKLKYLPLNDSALWVIEQLTSQGESPYLFPSPATGKPYTTITRAFWVIRKKAGIPDNVRIHDLRHTFASRVVSRGRSLFECQKLLGHADPRTTMRYAHLGMGAMQEASNVAGFAVT
jgi:integrase